MKFINLFKQFAGLAVVAAVATSCDKVDVPEPLGDGGQTVVKIIAGGPTDEPGAPLLGVDFVNTAQTALLADIRRDVPSTAALNSTQTVTVKVDTAMLRAFNEQQIANGLAPYSVMPSAWYTGDPAFTWGGTFELTFAPGELAKQIKINIPNATLFDPSSTYAFPFTIISVSPDNTISNSHSIISLIGAKNDYDGVYEVTGSFVDYTNATFMGYYPNEYHLVTTGASSVDVKQEINGAYVPGYLFLTSPTQGSFYGAYGLTMTFDPSTNLISDLHNYYGDPTKAPNAIGNPAQGSGAPLYQAVGPNFRRAVLDPTGVNHYDPASKTVTIKYWLVQANTSPGNPRAVMTETWRYIGSR